MLTHYASANNHANGEGVLLGLPIMLIGVPLSVGVGTALSYSYLKRRRIMNPFMMSTIGTMGVLFGSLIGLAILPFVIKEKITNPNEA